MPNSSDQSKISSIQARLKAALFYDGIAEKELHLHLANVMGISKPIAKRMLHSEHKTILRRGIDACYALDISVDWLYMERLACSSNPYTNNRTMRIHIQTYKGYPKEIADKAMRFHFAIVAGQTKALNLLKLVSSKQLNYIDALKMH